MVNTILDIKEKLSSRVYRNEEHVRLSIVCRILQELGWDIWNPNEVYTEFPVAKAEDSTRVDIALREMESEPSVYIEVKAVGKLLNLPEIEIQIRNYNRDNTAPFSIITDGEKWYFYFTQTGGDIAQKKFKTVDFKTDDINEVVETLKAFLSKEELINGNAKQKAEKYLQLSKEKRAIKDCEQQADKLTKQPPYPSLPEAIETLMKGRGYTVSREKIIDYLSKNTQVEVKIPTLTTQAKIERSSENESTRIETSEILSSVPHVIYSTLLDGEFNGKPVTNWNKLLEAAINECFSRGLGLSAINQIVSVNLKQGFYDQGGYKYVNTFDYSYQGMNADNCLFNSTRVAKYFSCSLIVKIKWGERGQYPNQIKEFRLN